MYNHHHSTTSSNLYSLSNNSSSGSSHHVQSSSPPLATSSTTLPPLNSFQNYSVGAMQNFDGFPTPNSCVSSPSYSLPTTPTMSPNFALLGSSSPLNNNMIGQQQLQLATINNSNLDSTNSTSAFGRASITPDNAYTCKIKDQVSRMTDRDRFDPISSEILATIRQNNISSPTPNLSENFNQQDSANSSGKKSNSTTSEDEESDEEDSDSQPKKKKSKLDKKNCHPIACVQCRSLHKKCDKKLPSCSKCISRGIECTYNTPRKRGKVSKKQQSEDKRNDNTITLGVPFIPTQKPNNHLAPQTVIDTYFAFLCGGHPAIDKKKFEHYTQNYYSYVNSMMVIDDYNIRLPPPEDQDGEKTYVLAFYLTVQALCEQRYGMMELSEESHKHAEKEVSRLVDYFNNFYIVACYINMALYESGCGNYHKARFYLNNVNFYFEDEENKNKDLNFYEQNLKKFRVFVVGSCHADIDTIGSMGTFVEMMPRMFKLASGGQEMQLPPECWKVFNSRNVTPDNYMLFMQIMDMVSAAFEKYRAILYGMAVDCHSSTFFKFQDLQRAFVTNGIRFLLLEKVVSVASNFAEETALKITLLTEHELFPFSGLGVILGIINTCKYHLSIVKQIESGMRPSHSTIVSSATNKSITIDYFSILQKDLRALQILAKKYKRITLYHSQMMEEMDQILQRKLNSNSFNNPLQIQPLNNFIPPPQANGTDNPNDMLLSTILNYLKSVIENQTPPNINTTSNSVNNEFGFPWE